MAERQIISSSDLPGNSKKKTEASKEPKSTVKPVVKGGVKKREKTLGTKVKNSFVGDDAKSVGEYVVMDVLLPAAKRAISDGVSQGIERLLFGEVRTRPAGGAAPRTRYTSYSSPRYAEAPYSPRSERREVSHRARATHDFTEIILEDRMDAEAVIDQLGNLIDQYEVATVSDFYDLVGVTGEYTDRKWGWTDIRGARAQRVRDGYLLVLPEPKPVGA